MPTHGPPLVASLDILCSITPTASGKSPTGSRDCCRFALALAVLLGASGGCGSLIVTQRSIESLVGQRGFEWRTHDVDGFVVYFEPGSAASRDLEAAWLAIVDQADAKGIKYEVSAVPTP